MKREWFEPGPDGVSPFERLSKTKGFGAAGTAAAFRALLAGEDGGRTADAKDAKDAEIAELRESLERSRLALNTTRQQRDQFWSQRDAARAEVERLQGELRYCNRMNRDLTAEVERWKSRADAHEQNYRAMLRRVDEVVAERDALQADRDTHNQRLIEIYDRARKAESERDALRARIDAGVRAWEKWKQQCGSLWLWAFPGVTASQEWSDVCDALDADYVVYPIEQADERKGKADRREIGCDASYEARIAVGRDHTREYQTEDIDCDGTVKCARSNDRRRTPGTRADRGKAS